MTAATAVFATIVVVPAITTVFPMTTIVPTSATNVTTITAIVERVEGSKRCVGVGGAGAGKESSDGRNHGLIRLLHLLDEKE